MEMISTDLLTNIMVAVGGVLWAIAALLFWKNGLQQRVPAMGLHLILGVAHSMFYLFLATKWVFRPRTACFLSFYEYWVLDLIQVGILFVICIHVFRRILELFPAVKKIGVTIFGCAAVVSIAIALFTTPFTHLDRNALNDLATRTFSCIGLLQVFLFSFLCFLMRALKLPLRQLEFGICLGLGLLSAMDPLMSCFNTIFAVRGGISTTGNYVFMLFGMMIPMIWISYFARPAPEREPLQSGPPMLSRWNEIAESLGHMGIKVALHAPSGRTLLRDVDQVAEKVLLSRDSEAN